MAIRIGIHVGEPILDAGEYVGTPVVVVQRLCETAAPGQILASELVAELVESRGLFAFDTVGALGIKGFREPVLTVELLDETPSGARARTPARPPYKGLASYEPSDSEIFFGPDYKVLRGGSWATRPGAIRNTFRNWDYPIRRQIFSGFRIARDD
jgi:hypothetical protein